MIAFWFIVFLDDYLRADNSHGFNEFVLFL